MILAQQPLPIFHVMWICHNLPSVRNLKNNKLNKQIIGSTIINETHDWLSIDWDHSKGTKSIIHGFKVLCSSTLMVYLNHFSSFPFIRRGYFPKLWSTDINIHQFQKKLKNGRMHLLNFEICSIARLIYSMTTS